MQLSIIEAMEELQTILNDFDLVLTDSQKAAINLGISALETIEDGNYELKGERIK